MVLNDFHRLNQLRPILKFLLAWSFVAGSVASEVRTTGIVPTWGMLPSEASLTCAVTV